MKKFIFFTVCTLFLFSSCSLLSHIKKEKTEDTVPLSKQIADNGYDATVYFKVGSYELDFRMEDILKRVARLQAISKTDVFLKGHSDITGKKELNFTLSEQRVESVKRYLMVLGVKEEWIHTSFYGDEIPAVLGETPEAFSKNRRVEIALQMVRDEEETLKLTAEEEKKQDKEIKNIDSGIKKLEEEQVQELEAQEKKMNEEKPPFADEGTVISEEPADAAAEVSEGNTEIAKDEPGNDTVQPEESVIFQEDEVQIIEEAE